MTDNCAIWAAVLSARPPHIRTMYEYLLTVDGDEARARAQAETIADQPESAANIHTTILHVFTENDETSVQEITAATLARDILTDAGIAVDLDETVGDPTTAILEKAEQVDANRICVSGKKRTPTGKVIFGSVTQGIILSTQRPVLVCSADD
ncbi:universal stress protein [Halocatena marina]|uniref:Universal stress protein n=2 Tax=Halocatena marina TaxID=2934937 RepID=A0ABD5YTF0_9EURY